MEKERSGKRIKVGRKERETEETKNMENEGTSFFESMKIEEHCFHGPAQHRQDELGPFYPNNLKALTVFKGSKNNVVSFDKSEFLVRHPVCIEYYNWIQNMLVADESFFQTLLGISKVEKVDGKWKVTQDLKMKSDKHLCP